MLSRSLSGLLIFMSVAFLLATSTATATEEVVVPDAKISFEKDVRPILQAACFHCHGEEAELGGGLDLRQRRFLLQGGDSGPGIVPGDPENSVLLERIVAGDMPPQGSGHPLTDQQQQVIRAWLQASAPTLRSEPETLPKGMVISLEHQQWWSFQPVSRPAVPEISSQPQITQPVDRFILQQLQAQGFALSPVANHKTLIRRAYYDLWGLPPAPEAVAQFENAAAENAWETLVDELLTSDHFGERWARHWLDVVGYADSEGVTTQDPVRNWAWQYRDYVIQAFNANKPYDQFLTEQLAGDELVPPPYRNMTPDQIEKLTATGFLRMAPDGTMDKQLDPELTKNEVVANTVEIVSSILLGLTVECAQCHEHRYDPIPQADYYRLRAIFEPALNTKSWKVPQQRLISLYTDEDRKAAAEIEQQAKKIMEDRLVKQQEFIDHNFEKELEKLTEEEKALAVEAHKLAEKDRTPEQKAVYKKYPSLAISAGSLYLYDKAAADKLKKMADEAAALRATKPQEHFLRALTETPGQLPETFIFYRGDHQQPREQVEPAGLTILSQVVDPRIEPKNPELPTSGRRLAFARQLTNGQHPLTARVFVNRVWMHLLGRGIVSTPADFGWLGTPPSHPELLDWLTVEFVESGWDIKRLIKTIMMSETYRQSLSTDSNYLAADPDIALFGSARLKRVDAEVLRDMVLGISGKLNTKPFGPPVPVMADPTGQWVIGIENLNAGRPGPVVDMKGEDLRRSVYVQVRRSRPLSMFEAFDNPRMEPNCEQRSSSTVTPQSLLLMNGDFFMKQSAALATRLITETEDQTDSIIQQAWQLVYSRVPESEELLSAREFLEQQELIFKERAGAKDNPREWAVGNLCQILLSSSEFLYIE